jgi:hypothetical protein
MATILEMRLEAHYPQFKRIWVHGSNKGKYHLCITLFPRNAAGYQMVFGEVSVVDFDSVVKIIDSYLVNQNKVVPL